MSEIEPILLRPHVAGGSSRPTSSASHGRERPSITTFDRQELNEILRIYGRMVAAGEWRDYAIDFLKERAIFSVFRRSSEVPIYIIVKDPKLARKQGAFSVVAAGGYVLRRGHDLERVLQVLDKTLKPVEA